jgi:hypothetical protein
MLTTQQYYDIHSSKAVDHSLFDDLHELVMELGAVYLSDPVNTYNLISNLKNNKVGFLNNFVFALVNDDKTMTLTTNLDYKEKTETVDRIVRELTDLYSAMISVDGQPDLFDIHMNSQIKDYTRKNLRLSHLYIFSKEFQEVISKSKELSNIFLKIIEIRDQVFQDSFHLICKSYSMFGRKHKITTRKLFEMESDVFNESVEYLNSAIFRFDSSLNLQFSTSATQWIRRGIQEVISSSKHMTYTQYINQGNKVNVVTINDLDAMHAIERGKAATNPTIWTLKAQEEALSVSADSEAELMSSFVFAFSEAGYDENVSKAFFMYYNEQMELKDLLSALNINKNDFEEILMDCKEFLVKHLTSSED